MHLGHSIDRGCLTWSWETLLDDQLLRDSRLLLLIVLLDQGLHLLLLLLDRLDTKRLILKNHLFPLQLVGLLGTRAHSL